MFDTNSTNVKELDIMGTIRDGIEIGIKNIGPILVNLLLWVLTIWIPYINVGTTIGLLVGVVSKASKGEDIPFTEIFDAKYRKYMGEYFLTCGLISIGVGVGFIFFIIPGIVISIAWCFAPLLAIDKGKNPSEAITISNNITYGNKGRMFCIIFLPALACSVVSLIFNGIGAGIAYATGFYYILAFTTLISIALSLFFFFIMIGLQASLYKQLAKDI